MSGEFDKLLDPKDVGRVEVTSYASYGYGGDNNEKLKVTIYGKNNKPAQEVLMDVGNLTYNLSFTENIVTRVVSKKTHFEQLFDDNTSPFMKEELETLKSRLNAYEKSGIKVDYDFQYTNRDFARDRFVEDKASKTPKQIEAIANAAHKEKVFDFISTYEKPLGFSMLPLPTAGTLFGEDRILKALAKKDFHVGSSDTKFVAQIKAEFEKTLAHPESMLDGEKSGTLYMGKEVAFLKSFVDKLEEKAHAGKLSKHDITDYLTSLDILAQKGDNFLDEGNKKPIGDIAIRQGLRTVAIKQGLKI